VGRRRFVRVELMLGERDESRLDPVLREEQRVILEFRPSFEPDIAEVLDEIVVEP
jgi:hypothetical protein